MSRTWRIAAEIAAWSLFVVPLAALLTARRLLGYGRGVTREERIDALLRWYPARWRERHGAGLAELLRDADADGRDSVLLRLDVAREGVVERGRAIEWKAIWGGALVGTGWTMFFPQGIVAAVLTQVDMPPSWFLALNVGEDYRWLVVGFMVGGGLLLVDRGTRLLHAAHCGRASSAG